VKRPDWKGVEPEPEVFNLESALEQIVGDTGKVNPVLGGYEVDVLDPSRFPWSDVFRLLVVETQLEVWISKKDGGLTVVCEQPT
jgi:hypothetical protein